MNRRRCERCTVVIKLISYFDGMRVVRAAAVQPATYPPTIQRFSRRRQHPFLQLSSHLSSLLIFNFCGDDQRSALVSALDVSANWFSHKPNFNGKWNEYTSRASILFWLWCDANVLCLFKKPRTIFVVRRVHFVCWLCIGPGRTGPISLTYYIFSLFIFRSIKYKWIEKNKIKIKSESIESFWKRIYIHGNLCEFARRNAGQKNRFNEFGLLICPHPVIAFY